MEQIPTNAEGGLSNNPSTGALNSSSSGTNVAFIKPNFSSLPLQMAVYFGYHYTSFFFGVNICLFTYKALRYYYPPRFLGWELTTVFLFIFIDMVRLLMVSKGNKVGDMGAFITSLVLAIPMIILHTYYIALQTYVLRVDVVLNALAFVLLGIQILMSCLSVLNIHLSTRKF